MDVSRPLRWNAHGPAVARRLLLWPGFPLAFQLLGLAGMALLAANGWGIGTGRSAEELLTLRKTNLTTLLV